jgi:hypothetical protein
METILFLKQLAKPLATIAKERAKQSYFFRTYICMPPAQCKMRLGLTICLDFGDQTG